MRREKQEQGPDWPCLWRRMAAAGIGALAIAQWLTAAAPPATLSGKDTVDAPAGLPPAVVFDAKNPPLGLFEEEWMEVTVGGQKAGYSYNLLRRAGERILTEQRVVMKIGRMGNVAEIQIESATEETLDGEPRAFHAWTKVAQQPTLVEGQGDGHTFEVKYQAGDYREQKSVTLPPGTVMAWGLERLMILKGITAGTHYTLQAYTPEDDWLKPMPVEVTVGGKEKISVRGQEIEATRIDTLMGAKEDLSGVKTTSWVDAGGRTLKSRQSMGGVDLELVVATQAQALANFLPADIFSTTMIQLDRPVPAKPSVTYLLKRKSGQPLPVAPESATQHSEVLKDGTVRVTLSKTPTPVRAPAGGAAPLDTKPFLARNGFMDTQDNFIKQLAVAGGGPADSPPALVAGQLREFVRVYIDQKNMDVGFATASEVARRRMGDCTEHAVFLAALGRARGLPTRVMAGLAYLPEYGGKEWVLGYHMWAQFYLDGRWVDFDAALPDEDGPPRRLGLRASDLNDTSMADFSLGLMEWMDDLQVTVEPSGNGA